MRVVIAGAGSVGRSIARELLAHEHEVVLVDKSPAAMRVAQVPEAEWLLADACELGSLEDAQVTDADVVVGATGDDKVNLVFSLLCKTEFGVPRTVARVNNPKNEWMFDGSWGVDVAVSTPRIMTSMVEEAVAVGDLVRIFTFRQSRADLVEVTLPADSVLVGRRVGSVTWPRDTVLACVVRGSMPIAPSVDDTLETGDELLLVVGGEGDHDDLQRLLVEGDGHDDRPDEPVDVPVAADEQEAAADDRPEHAGDAEPRDG
ncbi:TrkA family potassium uptake protein [Isoptericola cucumis]|uniref:potassium channel family protein n=1 Tax=Isoptericola cucumis TaxID=1776856 RepID=UPI00320AC86E